MKTLGIERALKNHQDHGGEEYYTKYELLKRHLLKTVYTQTAAAHDFKGGNDHGPGHIERVLEYLDLLISLGGSDPLEHLNIYELYIAMMAIVYHDVGLIHGRKGHPQAGAKMLEEDENYYVFEGDNDYIATAVRTHGSNTKIEDISKRYGKLLRLKGYGLRLPVICALVRLADELDEDRRRGDERLARVRNIADISQYPDSEFYWRFNQRILGVFPNTENRAIEITFELKTEDLFHRYLIDQKNISFVRRSFNKILKINKERTYCNSFLPAALQAREIRLMLPPIKGEPFGDELLEFLVSDKTKLPDLERQLPKQLTEEFILSRSLQDKKSRAFRVIILSTNYDLRDARDRVAGYLQSAMGIDVIQASASYQPQIEDIDLAILLQGWWWDGGGAVQFWKNFAPEKRLALFVDENSDKWPPRKLAERGAESAIEEFRQGLNDLLTFEHPDQLPELVGNRVASELESRHKMTGYGERGLSSWERAYVAFRLSAWSAGRTAAGTPHLIDAEEATELYKPELYVPMDGTSERWILGANGEPSRLPADLPEANKVQHDPDRRRIRLAKWASIASLPRLVLEGAPGGGKTVFLTRVASALGNFCLGRPAELEELNMQALRDSNALPLIPIVLEATRIADRELSSHSALIGAIADEVMSAPATEGPNRIELEVELLNSLKGGRYLILIDALDEIADANKRSQVLQLLKGMAAPECFPRTRIVLTTRSARYTGNLAFGPEFEVANVASLSSVQVTLFCAKWSNNRSRDEQYRSDLMSAVQGLGEQVEAASEEQSLTGNPLMLTAICMVYERYRNLPEDRARLCALLVDDLCRSRRSEDLQQGWRLDDAGKKDLLHRIALEMQKDGAQSWPESRARIVALTSLPSNEPFRELRAARHIHWAADHTGLLRFHQPEHGQEEVRFWHRLFREYLAASRLAQEDRTVKDLASYLFEEKWLVDPFWEDVIRLLPRVLGTWEKASGFMNRVRELSTEQTEYRGRLLGLAAAGIIESRELFPRFDLSTLADEMTDLYSKEGIRWPLRDRILFLDGLGGLDPNRGDPRLLEERWIEVRGSVAAPTGRKATKALSPVPSFHVSWAPVSVQQYRKFTESAQRFDVDIWQHAPVNLRKTIADEAPAMWRKQLRHLNRPVCRVTWHEAMAYCNWLTKQRTDGKRIRLPSQEEWEFMALRNKEKSSKAPAVVDKLTNSIEQQTNLRKILNGQPAPIGALFCEHNDSAVDLYGNIFEYCFNLIERNDASLVEKQILMYASERRPKNESPGDLMALLRGASFSLGFSNTSSEQLRLLCAAYDRPPIGGFRCILTSSDDAISHIRDEKNIRKL